MLHSLDRAADLFETAQTRALLVDNLPVAFAPYSFSELAKAVRDRPAAPRGISTLGREFRRAGLAMHQARIAGHCIKADVDQLTEFTRAGCRWWATTVDHDGPGLVATHVIEPCAQHITDGNPERRDDAYAALRALATRLGSFGGFQQRWTLDITDTA
jgi:hypothetical protein